MQSRQKREEIHRALAEAIERNKFGHRQTFARKVRVKKPKPRRLIAYDFETTRIEVGTPIPLYLTAYGAGFAVESPISSARHLTALLRTQFLTPENLGASFVAWNGNRFDAYFIAAALVHESDLMIRPYMTKSKALRGMRILRIEDRDKKNAPSWEFLCGIAMTGLVGVKLEKFVANFAPDFPKLSGTIDFEKEQFDPENAQHRAYAMRDSEGLYHAISHAQQIMLDTFDQPLTVTMGGACIKIFQAHIPEGVEIEPLIPDLADIVSHFVMRGGFCFHVRRYMGPIWKYDLNQVYAAAMREAQLPKGGAIHVKGAPPAAVKIYIARVTATNPANRIPFYCREIVNGRIKSVFATTEIADTWLTSIEVDQLRSEGWRIQIIDAYAWPGSGFSMTDYVNKLERLRAAAEGGPSGPKGTMVKNTGNHSYGKTVENIEPVEYIIAAECPDDALPFYDQGPDPLEHIFYRIDEDRKPKAYHQPHLGAWITAYVRMVVRRAALCSPDTWLYADTDCVVFSSDVTHLLDIDPKRYGAWKIEESGTVYQMIAKKVYSEVDPTAEIKDLKRSAKGMNVKRLSVEDFAAWSDGTPPMQDQIQINNFLSVVRGIDMYRAQRRHGTGVVSA